MQMKKEDQIDCLLQATGISPDDISYVILSHFHPDHLGGAGCFKQARFLVTEKAYHVYQKPSFKDLIFKEFLPDHFEESVQIMQPQETNPLFLIRQQRISLETAVFSLVPMMGTLRDRVAYSFQSTNCLSELISVGELTFSP